MNEKIEKKKKKDFYLFFKIFIWLSVAPPSGFSTCFSAMHIIPAAAANTAAIRSDWPSHHHQPWTVATHSLIGSFFIFFLSPLLLFLLCFSKFFIILGWCFSFSCFTILNGPQSLSSFFFLFKNNKNKTSYLIKEREKKWKNTNRRAAAE